MSENWSEMSDEDIIQCLKKISLQTQLEAYKLGSGTWKQGWHQSTNVLQDIKAALMGVGRWQLENDVPSDKFHTSTDPVVLQWLESSRIDFTGKPDDWKLPEIRVGNLDFPGDVKFSGLIAEDSFVLSGCAFFMKVLFNSSHFKEDVSFASSRFYNFVTFYGATFERTAIFRQTYFHETNIFMFADFQRSINLQGATFYKVPNFSDAKSFLPPRMDDVRIKKQLVANLPSGAHDPRPWVLRNILCRIAPDANTYAQFQKLRVFAKEANDHRIQSEFYAREVEARRFWVDHPFAAGRKKLEKLSNDEEKRFKLLCEARELHKTEEWLEQQRLDLPRQQAEALKENGSFWRFWMGLAFGTVSNFGGSLIRPLVLLVFIFFAFTFSYFAVDNHNICNVFKSEKRLSAALTYSISNSFVGVGTADVSLQRQAVETLKEGAIAPEKTVLELTWLSHLQKLLSFVCLFMFGMGIRNALKLT